MWYRNVGRIFFRFVTKHACDGQTYGRTDRQTDRITIPKTTLAYLLRVIITKYCSTNSVVNMWNSLLSSIVSAQTFTYKYLKQDWIGNIFATSGCYRSMLITFFKKMKSSSAQLSYLSNRITGSKLYSKSIIRGEQKLAWACLSVYVCTVNWYKIINICLKLRLRR